MQAQQEDFQFEGSGCVGLARADGLARTGAAPVNQWNNFGNCLLM